MSKLIFNYDAEHASGGVTGTKLLMQFVILPTYFSGTEPELTVDIYWIASDVGPAYFRIYTGGTMQDPILQPDADGDLQVATGPIGGGDIQKTTVTFTRPTGTDPILLKLTGTTDTGSFLRVGMAIYDDVEENPPNNTGVALVFDLKNPMVNASDAAGQLGQWYTRGLKAYPVDARMHDGVVHWLDSFGYVRREVVDQWYDSDEAQGNQTILPRYKFAQISAAGLQNAEKLYRVLVDGEFRDDCTQRVTTSIAEDTRTTPVDWTDDVVMTDGSQEEFDFNPDPSRASTFELTIEEVAAGQYTEGWRLRSIAFEVGTTGRMRKLATTQKIGD